MCITKKKKKKKKSNTPPPSTKNNKQTNNNKNLKAVITEKKKPHQKKKKKQLERWLQTQFVVTSDLVTRPEWVKRCAELRSSSKRNADSTASASLLFMQWSFGLPPVRAIACWKALNVNAVNALFYLQTPCLQRRQQRLFVGCLVGCLTSPATCKWHRDGFVQTSVRAFTLRRELKIKPSVSPSNSTLTPGRPVS